jgi:hypothetical protein
MGFSVAGVAAVDDCDDTCDEKGHPLGKIIFIN